MDKAKFFASVRVIYGTLSNRNVETIEAILEEAAARKVNNEWLAYILATAHGEASFNYAKRENMKYSAKRIGEVFPRVLGREKELANNSTALANAAYANMLGNGNEASGDGWTYRGAGLAQITGKNNYAKFGIASNPSLAIEKATSVRILFDGMINGMFTGKKLADYDVPGGYDFHEARRIINGTASAAKYAGWAQGYLDALEEAGRVVERNAPIGKPSPEKASWVWALIVRLIGSKG